MHNPLKSVTHGQCSARPLLPSQPQGITAPWPVLNHTAWWQRYMCANNLPKVVTWKREAGSQTRGLRSRESNSLTTAPPGNSNTSSSTPSIISCLLLALSAYGSKRLCNGAVSVSLPVRLSVPSIQQQTSCSDVQLVCCWARARATDIDRYLSPAPARRADSHAVIWGTKDDADSFIFSFYLSSRPNLQPQAAVSVSNAPHWFSTI